MTIIKKLAVKATQGGHTLFFTSFTIRDFFNENFYRVDKLDIQESAGIQRLLNESRARSFGKDIGNAGNEAFLPTSIFLATGKNIDYNEETHELSFDSSLNAGICPLDVVDGQHRIEGLKMVAKEKDLMDFPISAVIATNMSEPEKMLHFVTVNTKQRPVDKGVSQHIISRFNKMLEVEKVPYLPQWLMKRVESGNDAKALKIVQHLNSDKNSSWYGRIRLANEDKTPRHSITQASFVSSVIRYLFTSQHPLSEFSNERRLRILMNFWAAVERIFVANSNVSAHPTVFKVTGLVFFHAIIASIINQLHKKQLYTTDEIEKCIMSVQPYLISTDATILSPDYWESGSLAGQLNRAGMERLASIFNEALAQANDDDIKL